MTGVRLVAPPKPTVAPAVRVWFVDVGEGDCTLMLDVASRRALLVDCPTTHVDEVQELLSREGATLDTVIVTHWDLDHYGGASRLAVGLPVNRVLYNHDTLFPDEYGTSRIGIVSALKHFLDIPSADRILESAAAGKKGALGEVRWNILAPNQAELTAAYVARKRNVASAVVDVSTPCLRILIGGDAVAATWVRLLAAKGLGSDVLRWPHHGADLAGDDDGKIRDEVLEAVQPRFLIVSAGAEKPYGHPSAAVIKSAAGSSSILCTQVTAGCFGHISRLARNSEEARASIAELETRRCAGTVCIDCWEDSYKVRPDPAEHEMRVQNWPQPMCKLAAAKQMT
jgi:beta-lactamase superfamily II metal-dependent hydrolase